MKSQTQRLIKRGTMLLLLALALFFVVDTVADKVVFEGSFAYVKDQYIREFLQGNTGTTLDYAFFGDSHTTNGITPLVIPNSYNFGDFTERYTSTYHKLRYIVEEKNIHINTLVLQVDANAFTNERQTLQFPEVYGRYMPYTEIAKIRNESLHKAIIATEFPFVNNGLPMVNTLLERRFGANLESDPWKLQQYRGWLELRRPPHIVKQALEDDFPPITQLYTDEMVKEYYVKTLQYAKEKNMEIVLLRMPMAKHHARKFAKWEVDYEGYYAQVKRLTESAIGTGYRELNYYDYFHENDEYFSDIDHLNPTGAVVFSTQLYEDLEETTTSKTRVIEISHT